MSLSKSSLCRMDGPLMWGGEWKAKVRGGSTWCTLLPKDASDWLCPLGYTSLGGIWWYSLCITSMVRFKLHTVIVYVKLRKAAVEDGFSDPKGLVRIAREKLLGYVLILNRSCFAGYDMFPCTANVPACFYTACLMLWWGPRYSQQKGTHAEAKGKPKRRAKAKSVKKWCM